MPKHTNENYIDIKNKLDFIGLNLDKIPNKYKKYEPLEFHASRSFEDDLYRVYKYVPINEIEILLTPTHRKDSLHEKYSKASPLYNYLVPDDESNILKHTTFLKMLNELNVNEIEDIDIEQKKFEKNIPFKIKYDDNYLWQIYYSEETNRYFMLVPTNEQDHATFFYILKEQLENIRKKKGNYIFVPVGNINYSREILTKDEVNDIEKYLWLFTKNWPSIYEVYDKKDKPTVHIVGNTNVYEKITSFYKIKFKNKEELTKFYKLIKALFILQTELPHLYNFDVKISSTGGLDFLYNTKIISYDNLSKMIKEEFEGAIENIKILANKKKDKKEELDVLKIVANQKDMEYVQKEKQIATFLNCKKSFFGKVKYFFRGKKKVDNQKEVNVTVKKPKQEEENKFPDVDIKDYYTIEDLLDICKILDELDSKVKSISLDIDALKRKIEIMNVKITNADTYIKEIEDHKKSIFDFWKFANKDNNLALTAGEGDAQQDANVKLNKTFDYELDFEDFGINIDSKQRNILTKEQLDSLYLMSCPDIFEDVNFVKLTGITNYKQSVERLKQEAGKEELLFNEEEFDIFGGRIEDKTKISVLDNKKHREAHKNKFKILDINKNTTDEDYQKSLVEILKNLNEAYGKVKIDTDLPIYMSSDGSINGKEFGIFNINPEMALKKVKNLSKINLYRVNLKEGMSVLAYSNIAFFDNLNKTLPIGMNASDELLIDMNEYSFELKRQKLFRVNQMIDDIEVETKIICVYEYDVSEVIE